MASMTMNASFMATTPSSSPVKWALMGSPRGLVVAKASEQKKAACLDVKVDASVEKNSGRRDIVFATAAAAAFAVARVALADDELKSGTAEAKKKYAAVCVTMPTAKICHK